MTQEEAAEILDRSYTAFRAMLLRSRRDGEWVPEFVDRAGKTRYREYDPHVTCVCQVRKYDFLRNAAFIRRWATGT